MRLENKFSSEMFLFLFLFLSILLLVNMTTAADVSNTTAYAKEGDPGNVWVHYFGSITTLAADSTDTHYTKAMWIAPFNKELAYFYMVMSNAATGTEDCNVTIQYSFDRTTWYAGAAASGVIKDQLTTTAVSDTVNTIVGVSDHHFNTALWMRLACDMQAGNPIATTLTWRIALQKPASLYRRETLVLSAL